MKKLIKLFLICTLVLLALGVTASAATRGYYTYTVSNGEATITSVDKTIYGDITIPSTLGGYPVTTIGERAFYDCSSLTSVEIGDSVTTIGFYAFGDCSSLTSVEIGDSVTTIGNYAFYYCSGLKSVVIGDSVTTIGFYAFGDCSSLTSVEIGDSVTTIGKYAFSGCDSLTSIEIPDSVTTIGEDAFYDCSNLTSVEIGDSVTTIGNYAFYYCSGLKSVVIGDSVTTIGEYAFSRCDSLTSVEIPDSVTTIGERAFGECFSLTSINVDENNDNYCSIDGNLFDKNKTTIIQYAIGKTNSSYTIPDSVTTIGDSAFYWCDSLTSVEIPDSVTTIGNYTFRDCDSLTSVEIPDSVTTIGNDAFYACDSLTSVEIGDSVTTIGNYAFYRCDNLTSVEIGDSVTTIGESAFNGCDILTSVEIPGSVTTIGKYAFSGCDSLTSIKIPDSVTTIGNSAFSGCDSLTSIKIPDSVTTIGNSAFSSCDGLTSINVDANNNNYCSIDGNLFNKNKTTLIQYAIGKTNSSYTIPDSVTTIGNYTFRDCDSLTSVEIPDSVTSIGAGAFEYCDSLTSVVIGDSVTIIGNFAFEYCDSLTSVVIGDSVTTIGERAFYRCNKLKEVFYTGDSGEGISIGSNNSAFYNASKTYNSIIKGNLVYNAVENEMTVVGILNNTAEAVSIPDEVDGSSVTTIGARVFSNCDSLTSVEIGDSVTTIGERAFYDCSSLTSVVIGDSVTTIGDDAFYLCNKLKKVFYTGDSGKGISIGSNNSAFSDASKTYNSIIKGNLVYNAVENEMTVVGILNNTVEAVSIPDEVDGSSVTRIGNYAFEDCTSLTSIEIPDSVTTVGESILYGCSNLEELAIPFVGSERGNSGTSDALLGYIFGTSPYTGSYAVKQNYTSTDSVTYYIPTKLSKVTVTDEKVIPYGAFSNCNHISKIVIEGNPSAIMANSFTGFYNLFDVVVKSEKVRYVSSNIFEGSDFPTLYGYAGSTTENYANIYNVEFYTLEYSEDYTLSGGAKSVNGKVVVNVKVSDKVKGKNLHIALYDKNKKQTDYMIVPTNDAFEEINVVFKDDRSAKTAKIFLWESLTSLTPIASAYETEIIR